MSTKREVKYIVLLIYIQVFMGSYMDPCQLLSLVFRLFSSAHARKCEYIALN
jgi:hypothetical protein